jgi:hypothetical protein
VTNSQGALQDRTEEHLGYTDKAIGATRRLLLRTIRDFMDGGDSRHLIRDPRANDFPDLVVLSAVLPAAEDWRTSWKRNMGSTSGRDAEKERSRP